MQINTEGVQRVGEITSRTLREAQVEEDYRNASIAGAGKVLTETLLWVETRILASGPYDDTRALQDLTTWLADKIREVHAPATEKDSP